MSRAHLPPQKLKMPALWLGGHLSQTSPTGCACHKAECKEIKTIWNPFWLGWWPDGSYRRTVQKVSTHVIRKIETFIEEDTRYKKHCTQDNDASVPFKVGTLGPHTVIPITISFPITFSWISVMVWNLFPSKGDFSFGKGQKSQGAYSELSGEWVTWMIWCFFKKLHEPWYISRRVVMMKLPITSCPCLQPSESSE